MASRGHRAGLCRSTATGTRRSRVSANHRRRLGQFKTKPRAAGRREWRPCSRWTSRPHSHGDDVRRGLCDSRLPPASERSSPSERSSHCSECRRNRDATAARGRCRSLRRACRNPYACPDTRMMVLPVDAERLAYTPLHATIPAASESDAAAHGANRRSTIRAAGPPRGVTQ
jgi:hypothetical protein